MKYLFCLIIALSFGLYQAFWTECPGSGVIGPDSITSPNCTIDRCRVTRGQLLSADILVTWSGSHSELRTRITAFLLGIGINLPIDYPFDNVCNVLMLPDGSSLSCPTVPNVQNRIPLEMLISSAYPAMNNARVQVDFFDGSERVACGLLTAVDIL
ncbi:unnamed protein product [Chironomus riparius]|uniref:MD-2-related lipid-recognition domain-containing protein n=1 Tax=Chironomus riparius TaxID=315576 RepID=A0A9N9RU07_9DIPT|nr:unnamed protein product [Chironomus riparius]